MSLGTISRNFSRESVKIFPNRIPSQGIIAPADLLDLAAMNGCWGINCKQTMRSKYNAGDRDTISMLPKPREKKSNNKMKQNRIKSIATSTRCQRFKLPCNGIS